MIRATEAPPPPGRLAEPSGMAAAALFLASKESSFVNGSELFVNGGSAQIQVIDPFTDLAARGGYLPARF